MTTEIRVSITGGQKDGIRKAIADLMVSKGFKRRNFAEFINADGLSPERAAAIISSVYEIEGRYAPAKVRTLLIRSDLVQAELRRDRYHSM